MLFGCQCSSSIMEIFIETVKVLTASLSKYATSIVVSASSKSNITNRVVLRLGRARHNSSVRRSLTGKLFNFNPFRENADTRVEVVVKPIDDEEAIKLGADLVADVLLMSLMFSYMFYSLYLRRKKYNDLCNKQAEQLQFIAARLDYLEAELKKIQQQS